MPVEASNVSKSNGSTAYRGIKYRLCPGTQEKAKLLHGLIGACLFTWNVILKQVNTDYEESKKNGTKPASVSFFSLNYGSTMFCVETIDFDSSTFIF